MYCGFLILQLASVSVVGITALLTVGMCFLLFCSCLCVFYAVRDTVFVK